MTLETASSRIAGRGLIYPTTALSAERSTPLLTIPTPLIALPDDKHLDSVCSWCLLYRPEDASDDPADSPLELKRCTGCRVVRYCSKTCQSKAWKAHHKFECPRYAALYPNILPASVRACVRLLLLRKFKKLSDEAWENVLKLETHVEELVEVGGEKGNMIKVMAKGAEAYSATELEEEEVLKIYCRLLINTFTITPPTSSEELGLAFDPKLALMNHSCAPSALLQVNGAEATVIALKDIHPGDEITVCYVDPDLNVEQRRKELKERWFFECDCKRCELELQGRKWKGKARATEEEIERWGLVGGSRSAGRILGEV